MCQYQRYYNEFVIERGNQQGEELDKLVQSNLKQGKRSWSKQFKHNGKIFRQEWIVKYDGKTQNGEKCNLNFNSNDFTFDTGKPENKNFLPVWVYYKLVNNGEIKDYERYRRKFRVCHIRARTIGKSGKIEFSGRYQRQAGNSWALW